MASRMARSAIAAPLLRPTVARTAPAISAIAVCASSTNTPNTPEAKKTQSIIDALPGSSLFSKSAILSSTAALSVYAISNEYYIVNEETVVAFCLLGVWGSLIKFGGPAYSEWAKAQNDKIKNILNQAREDHTQAVKTRIESVEQMSGVVDITKTLFEVSKDTAHAEAQAFELEQKTSLAAEAKSVLDSWVRYESQVKARQQKETAEHVIAKVTKELTSPKALQDILKQSITEVEKIVSQAKA